VEPLLFLAAIGIGLGRHIDSVEGIKYSHFVASGLLASTAMFTATFELTYGTYIRMEFEKVYDAILSTPVGLTDAFVGEILWAGSKGVFFSTAVLLTISLFGMVYSPLCLIAPLVGGLTGIVYGALGLIVTSYVKDINNFNFYVTGCCTPMFFLSGIFIPIRELPVFLQKLSYWVPLTHSVSLIRGLILGKVSMAHAGNLVWLLICIPIVVFIAVARIRKRLIA
jgi:lipooligosaccharide transport system permease protein